ncbi:MAG: enoyl-ACP reductase FabI [Halocynthiibacter sp.]
MIRPDFDINISTLDLSGKKGLVVGIANEHSLAWSAARHYRAAGAELAITYVNERTKPYVAELAEAVGAEIFLPCDVAAANHLEAVFERITQDWGRLDFLLHAVGSVRKEDINGRLTDCSSEGFAGAMLDSCYSFIRMAKLAEPLMTDGGSLTTLSYYGAEKVVEHYNVMGPVKAALEASVKYLAHELGRKAIRVNAISAGVVATRAASGLAHFEELLEETREKAPLRRTITSDDVGRAALMLASECSGAITGEILHVDAGFHIDSMVFH